MKKSLSPAALEIVRRMQQNELTESVIYEKIAKFAKGEENKQTLLRLARKKRPTMRSGRNTPALK